jgi:hypothetical protein
MQRTAIIEAVMQSNPQMRAIMESNPEVAQMMRDPALLRQARSLAVHMSVRHGMQPTHVPLPGHANCPQP